MKDKNNAIRWGLTVFVTVAAILLFYDTLFRPQSSAEYHAAVPPSLTTGDYRRSAGLSAGPGH
ncbi:MAG: hypothetical protein V8R27_07420 [Oscillospiraceae bacterium]